MNLIQISIVNFTLNEMYFKNVFIVSKQSARGFIVSKHSARVFIVSKQSARVFIVSKHSARVFIDATICCVEI